MINQTLRSFNVLFKLFLSILLFKYYSAAPVNSSVTYNTFIEEITRNQCTFPSAVTLPFTSKYTFEYLAEPLQICKAPDAGKRYREATRLCSEIFDTLKNITCHPQIVQLPKIEVSFSENVCKDINTLTFPKETESLLKHLNDSLICDLMCDAEFLPACTVLLWSYEVQKQIEDAKISLKLVGNEETEMHNVETKKKVEEPTREETKQDKVTLPIAGNSEQNGKFPDNTKPTTNQAVGNEQDNKIPDTKNLPANQDQVKSEQDDKLPDNPKQNKIQENNKQSPPNIDTNQQEVPNNEVKISIEPNKNNDEKINRNSKSDEDLINNDKKQIQSVSKSQQNHQIAEVETKLAVNNKQNSKLEGQKISATDNVIKKGNKSILEYEINVSPKHNENNELAQKLNSKILSKGGEPDMSKQEKSVATKVKNETQKETPSVTTVDHNDVIQEDGNKEKDLKKPDLSGKKETNVPVKEGKDQISIGIHDSKVVTNPEMSSPQNDKNIQTVPTQPISDEETPKRIPVAETDFNDLPPPTTVADLEKMEDENEISEPNNKDQDSYNDLENEGDFSKVDYVYDYDGDDGFFEPPKSKKNEIPGPPKLPDPVMENQNDMSKYPIFPARHSVGQPSDDIQAIPTFPEQEDSHFFFYFLTIVVVLMAGYLIFHNKQKIIALIVEGRHERRRRSHGAGYKKLDTK